MRTPTFKNCLFWILPALLLIFSGWKAYSGQGGVTQIIKDATAPFNDEKRVSVPPLPGKTVLVKTKFLGRPFWTETRKDKLERFKCSQCHNNKDVKGARAAEIAHGDIVLVHGGKENPLSCFTCHKMDGLDSLVTEQGVTVDMDHSYQMCGQCHFRQNKDWVGGAHGKRVSFWAGKRVVKNCTSCHNPHSPRFEKRWPKTYSRPFTK
jgi:hypothetical protein